MSRHSFSKMVVCGVAVLGMTGLVASQAGAAISEDWESLGLAAGAITPTGTPTSGVTYNITTSGSNGLGAWKVTCSDTANAYYAIGNNAFGAGGQVSSAGQQSTTNKDASLGSMIMQSPAFTLSDAATGGSISMLYIGGKNGVNVPTTIAGLGTTTYPDAAAAANGFMGVALVDPAGNIVASSAGFSGAGAGTATVYNLAYSGLSPTTAYTFALIDNGTRNVNWGWNGVDNVTITAGTLVPEPTSLAALGLVGMGLLSRRKRV